MAYRVEVNGKKYKKFTFKSAAIECAEKLYSGNHANDVKVALLKQFERTSLHYVWENGVVNEARHGNIGAFKDGMDTFKEQENKKFTLLELLIPNLGPLKFVSAMGTTMSRGGLQSWFIGIIWKFFIFFVFISIVTSLPIGAISSALFELGLADSKSTFMDYIFGGRRVEAPEYLLRMYLVYVLEVLLYYFLFSNKKR